jgi:hypothetical protein
VRRAGKFLRRVIFRRPGLFLCCLVLSVILSIATCYPRLTLGDKKETVWVCKSEAMDRPCSSFAVHKNRDTAYSQALEGCYQDCKGRSCTDPICHQASPED